MTSWLPTVVKIKIYNSIYYIYEHMKLKYFAENMMASSLLHLTSMY